MLSIFIFYFLGEGVGRQDSITVLPLRDCFIWKAHLFCTNVYLLNLIWRCDDHELLACFLLHTSLWIAERNEWTIKFVTIIIHWRCTGIFHFLATHKKAHNQRRNLGAQSIPETSNWKSVSFYRKVEFGLYTFSLFLIQSLKCTQNVCPTKGGFLCNLASR